MRLLGWHDEDVWGWECCGVFEPTKFAYPVVFCRLNFQNGGRPACVFKQSTASGLQGLTGNWDWHARYVTSVHGIMMCFVGCLGLIIKKLEGRMLATSRAVFAVGACCHIFSGAKMPIRLRAFRSVILTASVRASLALLNFCGSALITGNAL